MIEMKKKNPSLGFEKTAILDRIDVQLAYIKSAALDQRRLS